MRTQVPDPDGSIESALGVTLVVLTLVLMSTAPVLSLGGLACIVAGYLLAGVHSRPRARSDARRRSAAR